MSFQFVEQSSQSNRKKGNYELMRNGIKTFKLLSGAVQLLESLVINCHFYSLVYAEPAVNRLYQNYISICTTAIKIIFYLLWGNRQRDRNPINPG